MNRLLNITLRTAVCGVVLALTSLPALAATRIYMTIEGTSQGKFKGEMTRVGSAPEELAVTSVSHQSSAAVGAASGQRQHPPVKITREIDAASPMLFRASSTGEPLREVVIHFVGAQGSNKTAETIVLNDASISSIQKAGKLETITFVYKTITVTYVGGGKTATDDWETR